MKNEIIDIFEKFLSNGEVRLPNSINSYKLFLTHLICCMKNDWIEKKSEQFWEDFFKAMTEEILARNQNKWDENLKISKIQKLLNVSNEEIEKFGKEKMEKIDLLKKIKDKESLYEKFKKNTENQEKEISEKNEEKLSEKIENIEKKDEENIEIEENKENKEIFNVEEINIDELKKEKEIVENEINNERKFTDNISIDHLENIDIEDLRKETIYFTNVISSKFSALKNLITGKKKNIEFSDLHLKNNFQFLSFFIQNKFLYSCSVRESALKNKYYVDCQDNEKAKDYLKSIIYKVIEEESDKIYRWKYYKYRIENGISVEKMNMKNEDKYQIFDLSFLFYLEEDLDF